MTSSAARQAFDSLPEAVRRGILDGDALRLYAVRVPVPRPTTRRQPHEF